MPKTKQPRSQTGSAFRNIQSFDRNKDDKDLECDYLSRVTVRETHFSDLNKRSTNQAQI